MNGPAVLRVAIVGRGRLGAALGGHAHAAGHPVSLLRRPTASPGLMSAFDERVLDEHLDWQDFDLVLLAFETHASSVDALLADPALAQLRRIPSTTPVGSVVMSPPAELIDALLPGHEVVHFLTTPAARLPGAIALLRGRTPGAAAIRAALPALRWIEAEPNEYLRLAMMMIGSGIAAAALAHLGRVLSIEPRPGDADYWRHVLEDAGRLLEITDGDGFEAFSLVATPGGFTEKAHNGIFAAPWPLTDDTGDPPERDS